MAEPLRRLSDPDERAYVVARMSEMQDEKRESVLAKAERLGIPVRKEGPGQKVSILYSFDGDTPIYRHTDNREAAISTGANLLRDGWTTHGIWSGHAGVDYRRSKALSGTSGQVEWITNLTGSTWSTVGVVDTLLNDQRTYENRRATVPISVGETKKFLRLRVTTP